MFPSKSIIYQLINQLHQSTSNLLLILDQILSIRIIMLKLYLKIVQNPEENVQNFNRNKQIKLRIENLLNRWILLSMICTWCQSSNRKKDQNKREEKLFLILNLSQNLLKDTLSGKTKSIKKESVQTKR